MPKASEEIVRAMIAAWNEGNVDRMIDFWSEEEDHWIWEDTPEFPGAGTFQGREAVEAHMREVMEIFESWQLTIDAVEDLGNEVFLVEVSGTVRGTQSGIELDSKAVHLVRFEDGRVRRYSAFMDREQALAAAERD